MTQALTPEIMFLYQARPKWRGSVHLAPAIMGHVEGIRAEIKSGEDSGGWGSVGGWRAGQARPGFTKPPTESKSGFGGNRGGFMNRGGGNGGGEEWQTVSKRRNDNGWSGRNNTFNRGSSDIPRFGRDAPETASVPLQSSRTVPMRSEPVKPKPQPTNDITPPAPRAYLPYKSMFTSTDKSVENTVVDTIIKDKLNKLSISNYDSIRDFLFEILDAGDTEQFLADFMKLIFHKAADSIGLSYCPLYARLLHELSAKYSFIQTEINAIYSRFLHVFNEVSDAGNEDMELFRQRNSEKKYRIGYSQFITELLKYEGIISDNDYINTVVAITTQMSKLVYNEEKRATVEEYADCLAKMIKILRTAPDVWKRLLPQIVERCAGDLKGLTTMSADKPGLSNKTRFAVMSILDSFAE